MHTLARSDLRIVATVLAMLLLTSCTHTRASSEEIRRALVTGDQAVADSFTSSFIQGTSPLPRAVLKDRSLVSPEVIVHTPPAGALGKPLQLGVERVADYFLCLLEIRAGVDAESLVDVAREDCQRDGDCEPCNSLTYPLPEDVREALIRAWIARGEVR